VLDACVVRAASSLLLGKRGSGDAEMSLEIVCLLQGSASVDYGGRRSLIGPGTAVVVRSGHARAELHFAGYSSAARVVLSGCKFAPPDPVWVVHDDAGEIGWLVSRIVAECSADTRSDLAEAYAAALSIVLGRRFGPLTPALDGIDAATDFIRSAYHQQVSLADIVSEARLSESYMINRFRARHGVSPMRFLTQTRMEAARRLLATTDLPIGEVGFRVGIPDQLYFSRTFKRACGCSPSEFRRESQHKDNYRHSSQQSGA